MSSYVFWEVSKTLFGLLRFSSEIATAGGLRSVLKGVGGPRWVIPGGDVPVQLISLRAVYAEKGARQGFPCGARKACFFLMCAATRVERPRREARGIICECLAPSAALKAHPTRKIALWPLCGFLSATRWRIYILNAMKLPRSTPLRIY